MKREEISQTTLRNYLLGKLDEQQTEALDELSVTSQEFADRITAEQYELVDEYVTGQLNSEDVAALARSPALLRRADLSRALIAAVPRAAAVVRPAAREPWWQRLFPRWPALAYSLAGLLIIAAIGALIVSLRSPAGTGEIAAVTEPDPRTGNVIPPPSPTGTPLPSETPAATEPDPLRTPEIQPSPKPTQPRQQASALATLVLMPPLRGTSTGSSVRIGPEVEALRLQIATDADINGPLRVAIADAGSDRTLWTSVPVNARIRNGRATVTVNVPARSLSSARVSVKLQTAGAEQEMVDEHIVRIDR